MSVGANGAPESGSIPPADLANKPGLPAKLVVFVIVTAGSGFIVHAAVKLFEIGWHAFTKLTN